MIKAKDNTSRLNRDRQPSVRSNIRGLRTQLTKLSNELGQIEETEGSASNLEEMATTLQGLGQGALSCMALLRAMTRASRLSNRNQIQQSGQNQMVPGYRPVTAVIVSEEDVIRAKASSALRTCHELGIQLRDLKASLPESPMDEGAISPEVCKLLQAVQVAVLDIASAWEGF